jgi:hypothetical protein
VPKSATQLFTSKPVAFMQSNVVLMNVNQMVPGVYDFKLVQVTGARGRRTLKGNEASPLTMEDTQVGYALIDVYTLDQVAAGPGTFPAYWLPYNNNAQFHLELRNQADFMFTPRMDGCAFAASNIIKKRNGFLGLFSGNKKVGKLVSHTNFQNPQGEIEPWAINSAVAHVHGPGKKKVLKKGDYSDSNSPLHAPGESIKLTTFGVRKAGKWKFYYQQYETFFTGDYLLLGVQTI